jgi:hypothetical protein
MHETSIDHPSDKRQPFDATPVKANSIAAQLRLQVEINYFAFELMSVLLN